MVREFKFLILLGGVVLWFDCVVFVVLYVVEF